MKRIFNAIKFGWGAFRNPETLNASNFKMLCMLFELILKVAKEDRHMMTHIAFIHPETQESHQIVSIWAGAGVGAEPTKRIKELLEENSRLKLLLREKI